MSGRACRMDVISNLGLGFAVALTIQNIAYCFTGVLLGTVIGVLPGIGPVTTVAMLLPISFTLAPESALILLAGIYYGAQYGGSTTAILVNIPGEASSVVTTIDGHAMARAGRADGIDFVALSMAIYGIAEVAYNLEQKPQTSVVSVAIGRVWPSLADLKYCVGAILRGTGLGAMLGVLPGGGALLASFAAYTLEKNVARPPRRFGHGDIRGVAAPESANNAGAQTSFIPMLTLGIPGNPTMAMMIGALMIHGIAPGPRVMTDRPGLFWGLIASMWLGNLMLVVLNLPMVGIWVRLLRVPYRLLYPAIIAFCCIGAYTINNKPFDAFVMAFFAVFGYVALKLDSEPAPLILGFVLGPMMEENLRRALLISRGDPMVFLQEPISIAFLLVAAGLLGVFAGPAIRVGREESLKE